MRKMGMLTMAMVAVVAMGCTSAYAVENGTAPVKTAKPLLRVFENGSGRIVNFDQVASYERAWDTGVLPGASSHGAAQSDSGWTDRREGCLTVTARTQTFADGTTIYRELTTDAAGHLVRVRFYDTHADSARQGFRLDGSLPTSLAFAPTSSGSTLAAK
jgi:hypothetical protein